MTPTNITTASANAGTRPLLKISGAVLITLALLSAVAPFATDLYLPTFPRIADDLATSSGNVQLSLSAFLFGIASGQLIFGPLSDRYGRRGPLIAGLSVYVVASVLCVVAPNIAVLIGARVVQGLTAAAGMVIGRAIVADVADGPQAAKALSAMMVVGGVAPVVAPVAGSLLASPLGWRGLLGVVSGLAIISLVCALIWLKETRPLHVRRAESMRGTSTQGMSKTGQLLEVSAAEASSAFQDAPSTLPSDTRRLWSRSFIGHLFAFAFVSASLFAYISASPFLYQELMGFSTVTYAIAFAVNSIGMISATVVSAKLIDRMSLRKLTALGMGINFGSAVLFLLVALSNLPTVILAAPIFLTVGSLGLVFGNATALAMSASPAKSTGLASALLGALQFGLGAVFSALVGLGGESIAVPTALVMVCAGAVSIAFLRWAGPVGVRQN